MTLHVIGNGVACFWNSGPTRRDLLEARLAQIDMERFTPCPRSDAEALKISMADYADGELSALRSQRKGSGKDAGEKFRRDKVIQAKVNQKVNGFELVDVTRHEESRNDYVTDFSAKVVEGAVQVTKGYADAEKLQAGFIAAKAVLGGQAVGQSLIRIIAELKGTTLRELGGIYWLPPESLPAWKEVIAAFESAGEKTKVYAMETPINELTVRAVKDAIVSEVMDASTRLTEEVTAGNLGETAIENRKKRALGLHTRVNEYEAILREALTDLHSVIAVAEQAAASAIAIQSDAAEFDGMYATA